ncbi:SEC-C metal-binding domain-containing protein [Paracoccus pantotrophus]|uniref:SEC-C metal-binding domain-containing protein n=1 Tax=Paracoccus pantotrophus TaxID=82367 RepID=UPI0023E35985|nr:SEC-C metal-binding domain-containing protein [Paracoccus pantotrophus]MDF3856232.1 SEC-C metal-binding domain-containing protein [Paracoccus pantotrophus]
MPPTDPQLRRGDPAGLAPGGRSGGRQSPSRPNPHKTPGRNHPCPCGSGRKYKQCCGKS